VFRSSSSVFRASLTVTGQLDGQGTGWLGMLSERLTRAIAIFTLAAPENAKTLL